MGETLENFEGRCQTPLRADTRCGEPWCALGVTAQHEKSVARILSQKGYETFLPLYVNRHQYAKRSREFELPLFPGYVFCRFPGSARLAVLTTPGAMHVVGAGREPVVLDGPEIASVQIAAKAETRMSPCPYWKAGRKGRITDGALAGVEGIVMSAKQPAKLVLSISQLKRSVLLEIDAKNVVLV
jgi:transcription termination/antitermination protein NusG